MTREDIKRRTPLGQMADIEEVLFTEAQIQARVAELGRAISADYAGRELFLLAILRGALMFMADLSRHLRCQTVMDFMVVSRYGEAGAGEVRIIKDLDFALAGRDVLIVEDIIDEGETLDYLMKALHIREPRSLQVVTLFDKPYRRKVTIVPQYNGFVVPDRFVVGYGLDYKQRYRNLPFLATLKREVCPY